VRTNANRIDVTEFVDLQSAQDCEVEEMNFPVDEIDHQWQIEQGLAVCDVLVVCRWSDHGVIGICHTAGTGHPPQRGRMHASRQVTGSNLNVGVGPDDSLFPVAQISRELNR